MQLLILKKNGVFLFTLLYNLTEKIHYVTKTAESFEKKKKTMTYFSSTFTGDKFTQLCQRKPPY
jgi:hypothetical protein